MLYKFHKADLESTILDCKQPPVTVARLLRDLLTTELPKTHDQGPHFLCDTVHDEELAIYFRTPVEIEGPKDGVFMLRIKGDVWTWNGEKYIPLMEHVDVLDIEILPSGTGGSKVRVIPILTPGRFETHVEIPLARVLGQPNGTGETDIKSSAGEQLTPTSTQDAGRGAGGEITLRLRKPGRKPDPLYNEAFQRIRNGEELEDTYSWFCEQANITKPDKLTRDAFKAAMKRRQNKT